jgi:hypothetical protein
MVGVGVAAVALGEKAGVGVETGTLGERAGISVETGTPLDKEQLDSTSVARSRRPTIREFRMIQRSFVLREIQPLVLPLRQ